MADSKFIFKGFKQVLEQEGLQLENGYIYFVRTNDDKQDGYLYFNGKKYGTAENVKNEILGDITDKDPKTIAGIVTALNELSDEIENINRDFENSNHAHANKEVIDGITADKVTAWDSAEQNAKAYADGLAVNYDAAGAAEAAETAAKAYADGLAVNYDAAGAAATAETAAKAYADGLAVNYDAAGAAEAAEQNAKSYTDELSNGAVKTNTEAIEKLNGTGEGSVYKQVTDSIAKVIASAPEDFDTLKEIADYIANDQTGAAELSNRVSAVEADKHSHANKEVIDGITADKVTAWDSAEQNAKAYADGLATNYDAAGAAATAEQNAKNYADGLNSSMVSRVETLEASSHEHANKETLDKLTSEVFAQLLAAITYDGDDVE